MKKISAAILALVMLFALCVPAFAGEAVSALENTQAKEIATAIDAYVANRGETAFTDAAQRAEMLTTVIRGLTIDNYGVQMENVIAVNAAVGALKQDYSESLTEELGLTLEDELFAAIQKAYAERPGITTFDPSQVVDNVADGFTEGDLSGLFDTLRNTITDLGDRVGEVFGNAGSLVPGGNDADPADPDDNSGDFNGKEPTGDTAIYAVAGVAVVAGVALLLTKKKKNK